MPPKRTHHGWMVLFKFGKRQFLEELRQRGLLYMNPSTLFAELEKPALERGFRVNRAQADQFEGTDFIYHPNEHEITIEGPIAMGSNGKVQNFKVTIPSGEFAAHTSLSLNALSCNIYCMYATTVPQEVDERNFEFGDSFVIILNTLEFLNRFSSAAANAMDLKYQCGLVDIMSWTNTQDRLDRSLNRRPSRIKTNFGSLFVPVAIKPDDLKLGT